MSAPRDPKDPPPYRDDLPPFEQMIETILDVGETGDAIRDRAGKKLQTAINRNVEAANAHHSVVNDGRFTAAEGRLSGDTLRTYEGNRMVRIANRVRFSMRGLSTFMGRPPENAEEIYHKALDGTTIPRRSAIRKL